jgi:hypothetical protein
MHTEISSDTHHSVNTDDNHNACDTSDEDLRPAKRRKPRSARAATPPLHLRRSSPTPPTTRAEIDEAQSHDDGCSSTFVEEQHCASRTSRSPSAAAEAVPAAEYQEWSFQGFLKRIRIGDDVTYNLEFKLPSISEHLQLPIDPHALGASVSEKVEPSSNGSSDGDSCKAEQGRWSMSKHTRWSDLEEQCLLAYRKEGKTWPWIFKKFRDRTPAAIRTRWNMIRPRDG